MRSSLQSLVHAPLSSAMYVLPLVYTLTNLARLTPLLRGVKSKMEE